MLKTLFAIAVAASSSLALAAGDDERSLVNRDDTRSLLNKIHAVDLAQIQEGKFAQSRSETDRVEHYGKQLVTDRSVADQRVVEFAQQKGIALSQTLPAELKNQVDDLRSMPDNYDQQLLIRAANQQAKLIDDLTAARPQIHDPEMLELIDAVLPDLRVDHQAAMSASDGVKEVQ